jgi:hypothetical protein
MGTAVTVDTRKMAGFGNSRRFLKSGVYELDSEEDALLIEAARRHPLVIVTSVTKAEILKQDEEKPVVTSDGFNCEVCPANYHMIGFLMRHRKKEHDLEPDTYGAPVGEETVEDGE